ncbi:Ribokinase (plasmid) [Roseivivax sp. THAF40]|uniref:PfkB family carbohydrate kinase n=1 Tax=unclassified Roseivivax TaxID=2639302 RepID=UPI00126950C5|nr:MULTISPECIES: PfkB family carbohydrate kinase [unclassified Roseivivax]QFS84938.1 Ribokinase [Roseivivax sp. THAF197b]QFT48639.1 Ribokinase [Roseivivax sp. THAF40]
MKAYVVGNAALDETLSIEDFPLPGASIFGASLSRDLGGKGLNQAIAIARAGLDCVLVAAIGQDARGQEIAEGLAAEPLTTRLVRLDGVATDASTILMAKAGENAVITTREAASALTPDMACAGLEGAAAGDLLVLQGNLTADTTEALMRTARAREMIIAMNPSPLQPYFATLWPLVDIAFVNEGETEALGGVAAILEQGVSRVVLTLGGAGAALVTPSSYDTVPAVPCTVRDTTGAGDCFMATALASAGLRGGVLDIVALGHAAEAAAHTVARPGTVAAFPTAEEFARILGEIQPA